MYVYVYVYTLGPQHLVYGVHVYLDPLVESVKMGPLRRRVVRGSLSRSFFLLERVVGRGQGPRSRPSGFFPEP